MVLDWELVVELAARVVEGRLVPLEDGLESLVELGGQASAGGVREGAVIQSDGPLHGGAGLELDLEARGLVTANVLRGVLKVGPRHMRGSG